MLRTYVSPKHLFSTIYVLKDSNKKEISRIGIPLLLRMLKSNSGYLVIQDSHYALVDSLINYTGAFSPTGEDKSFNTYIKDKETKVAELIYDKVGINDSYSINNYRDQEKFKVSLSEYGKFRIYQNETQIGELCNKEFILRRSTFQFETEVSALSQSLIFWGSINTMNI